MKIQMLAAAICGLSSVHAEQVEKVFQGKQELAVGYRYLLALPEGYEADASKPWPLIVFLHGAGERGEDLKLLLKHGPPKLIDQGKTWARSW
jgi:predicted peptidase